uniref:UBX domain-containing protein n=1 Tax=Rhabditophanes sp. KR3021 TaxID=114890 RepID=A0AC35TQM0_9BILA
MPKIQDLDSLRDKEENDSDDEHQDDDMSFFVGGGKNSGQAVFGGAPKNPEKDSKFADEIFDLAKKHGAEVINEDEMSGRQGASGSRTNAFATTTGYRLGGLMSASPAIPPSHPTARSTEPIVVDINVYPNGFSVGDGPLRLFQAEENTEFWKSIIHGSIPNELITQYGQDRDRLDVRLHRKTEDYVEKKKPFQGAGHRVGDPPGAAQENPNDSVARKAPALPADLAKAQEQIKMMEGEKVGKVRIRLPCGQMIQATLNGTHSIEDLRDFVVTAVPSLSFSTWRFMTSFPSNVFDDENVTLEASGILNGLTMIKFD